MFGDVVAMQMSKMNDKSRFWFCMMHGNLKNVKNLRFSKKS